MAKKKLSIKEQRELEAAKRKEAFQKQTAERVAKEEKIKAEEEKKTLAAKENKAPSSSSSSTKSTLKLKSLAKAAGVKSTFTDGRRIIMTSFGRGNEAVIEKHITDGVVENVSEKEAYSVSPVKKKINVEAKVDLLGKDGEKHKISTAVNVPLFDGVINGDVIGAKAALEQRFFGKTFDDNIHIQLIYNILDIDKILAVYSNNIVYTINNLARNEAGEDDGTDFIGLGYIGLGNKYEDFINPEYRKTHGKAVTFQQAYEEFSAFLENPRLGYFGNAFFSPTTKDEKYETAVEYLKEHPEISVNLGPKGLSDKDIDKYGKKFLLRNSKSVYYILALLSAIRQSCTHDTDRDGFKLGRAGIYNIENWIYQDARDVLDDLYLEKKEDLKSFAVNSCKSNFRLLFDAMGVKTDAEKAECAKAYYKFAVYKDYKNIGFSVKKLREVIIDRYIPEIKEDGYNSVRAKLYSVLDFMLVCSYPEGSEQLEGIVGKLRTTFANDNKDYIYFAEAEKIWHKINNGFETAKKSLEGVVRGTVKIKDYRLDSADKEIVKKAIGEVALPDYMDYFTEMVYMLTLFLDGKEINDLLTTLINKFDNIAAIHKVMCDENIECKFADDYKSFFSKENFFGKDGKCTVLRELRQINSIARMSGETEDAKRIMYKDALLLLGVSDNDDVDVEEYLDSFLDKKRLKVVTDKRGNKKYDTGYRNFIASNVIESWRFRYIIRYANPNEVREYTKNPDIVKLVLSRIKEDTIIDRYYKSLGYENICGKKEKISILAKKISEVTPDSFKGVNQSANAQRDKNKLAHTTLMSLYLNVLYQITKNIVNVNSRYVMAFHNLERDCNLFGFPKNHSYLCLNEKAIKEKREAWNEETAELRKTGKIYHYKELLHKNRVITYCEENVNNADEKLIKLFRNSVAHLNAVRNAGMYIEELKEFDSYFEIYHYIMQRSLEKKLSDEITKGFVYEREGKYFYKEKNGSEEIQINPKSFEYMTFVKEKGTYCKDFVKALCSPFAYNLARFKNLSIDGLFDMNDEREKPEKKHYYSKKENL